MILLASILLAMLTMTALFRSSHSPTLLCMGLLLFIGYWMLILNDPAAIPCILKGRSLGDPNQVHSSAIILERFSWYSRSVRSLLLYKPSISFSRSVTLFVEIGRGTDLETVGSA